MHAEAATCGRDTRHAPASLLECIVQKTLRARKSGSLQTILTERQLIKDTESRLMVLQKGVLEKGVWAQLKQAC